MLDRRYKDAILTLRSHYIKCDSKAMSAEAEYPFCCPLCTVDKQVMYDKKEFAPCGSCPWVVYEDRDRFTCCNGYRMHIAERRVARCDRWLKKMEEEADANKG